MEFSFHLLYGKGRETGLAERQECLLLLLQGHSTEQVTKPKPGKK